MSLQAHTRPSLQAELDLHLADVQVEGGRGERDTEVEAGSDEDYDGFKRMDAECIVCMEENKVSRQVAYSSYDLYVDQPTLLILMVSQPAVTFVCTLCALVRV